MKIYFKPGRFVFAARVSPIDHRLVIVIVSCRQCL